MRKDTFHPVLPLNLIQGIRLAHALMETRFKVCIPEKNAYNLIQIKHCFGVEYQIGTNNIVSIDSFNVNHKIPSTSVGRIEKTLIFPHGILSRCRKLWSDERNIKVSFAGLVTEKRKRVISQFCRLNCFPDGGQLPNLNPMWNRILNRSRTWLGLSPQSRSVEIGDLTLWASRRGRTFPVKAWDEEYYRLLGRSQFVLCPSGDYTWTYRFFESVLCGAVPIVEDYCEAYNGFYFYSMKEPLENMRWSHKIAEINYNYAINKLSIKKHRLENELCELISSVPDKK